MRQLPGFTKLTGGPTGDENMSSEGLRLLPSQCFRQCFRQSESEAVTRVKIRVLQEKRVTAQLRRP